MVGLRDPPSTRAWTGDEVSNRPRTMTDRDLFIAALDHSDPAARAAWLDRHCAGDPDRRRRVEVLLRAHEQASRFLADPARSPEDSVEPDDPTRTAANGEPAPAAPVDVAALLKPATKPGLLGTLDHYEVLEVVGRGGMGVVLKAFDPKLHRLVAVKLMAPHLAARGAARKRFEREARAVAAVRNEHVVAIHGVETDGPVPYLVMEFVGGISVQDRLDRRGPADVKELLRIGMQIATGLAAAHKQGIVHRDIKPSNILLENGVERVKITDFGLARMAADASLTHSGVITGTPNYMSPEQARGEPADPRSDLFSLGSVLYALAAGHPPFRAETPLGVMRRVCDDPVRLLPEVNPDVPPWLDAIVRKLLAKDPAARFQTAAEVGDLLGRHLAHLQHPHAVPMPEPVGPPADVPTPPVGRLGCVAAIGLALSLLVIAFRDTIAVAVFRSGLWAPIYMLGSTGALMATLGWGRWRARPGAERGLLELGMVIASGTTLAALLFASEDLAHRRVARRALDWHSLGLVLTGLLVGLSHLPHLLRLLVAEWQPQPGVGRPARDLVTPAVLKGGVVALVVGMALTGLYVTFATGPEKVDGLVALLAGWGLVALLVFGPGVVLARWRWRRRYGPDRRGDRRAFLRAGLGAGLTVLLVALVVVRNPDLRRQLLGTTGQARLLIHWDQVAVDRVSVEREGYTYREYDNDQGGVGLDLSPGPYVVRAKKDGREVYREELTLTGAGHGVSIFEPPAPGSDYGLLTVTCGDADAVVTLTSPTQTITLNDPGNPSVRRQPLWPATEYRLEITQARAFRHSEVVRMKAGEERRLSVPRIVLPERTVELKPKAGGFPTDVVRMEIAPDRSAVAVGRFAGPIVVFDTATGEERFTVDRPKSDGTAFGFTPNSLHLSYLTKDGPDHILRDVDVRDGRQVFVDKKPGGGRVFANAHSLAYSPDGNRLAVSSTYNAESGDWKSRVFRWEFSPAGPRELEPLEGLDWLDGMIRGLRFTGDGSEVLAVCGTARSLAWTWDDGKQSRWSEAKGFATELVAVGREHQAVAGWNASLGKASISGWESAAPPGPPTVPPPFAAVPFASLVVSPDDRWVAAGVKGGAAGVRWEQLAAVRVWERSTGREWAILRGHTDWPLDIRFDPTGRELVTVGKDGTVRHWRLP